MRTVRHVGLQPPCPPAPDPQTCERDRKALYDALAMLVAESACGVFDPSGRAWNVAEDTLAHARGEE